MDRQCFFGSILNVGSCGPSRGYTDVVPLEKCTEDISSHLANVHMSKENTTEKDLILARAGLFHLSDKQLENMKICPKHRHGLGKHWRPPTICQYPDHTGKRGKAGDHVINFKSAAQIRTFYGQNIPVGSPICTLCRKKHKDRVDSQAEWLCASDKDQAHMERLARSVKETAKQVLSEMAYSPSPRNPNLAVLPETPGWTPGPLATPIRANETGLHVYNLAMNSIAHMVDPNTNRQQLASQVNAPLKSLSKAAQSDIVQQAADDCLLICSAIAPGSGQELLESLSTISQQIPENDPPGDMVALMVAYRNACTKNLKKQILSLYVYRYPVRTLMQIHEPYGKLTTWEIKQARAHANKYGAGAPPVTEKKNRVRLDMAKVNHFLDFINRPYFYQDVSYGSKILTLDSGEKIEMPNVVRTVTRSTMIEQYLEFCNSDNCEPLSRSTLFKILEVREASQRTSLQGLDNSAANGAAGFQTLETIIDYMEKGGMKRQWCCNVQSRLRSAKRYLKTDYRVHCKDESSTCADHCRQFALSDANDSDFRQTCSHQHTEICNDCKDLKLVLSEIKHELQGNSWSPYSNDQRDDLIYDFEHAQSHIFIWKAHIVRSINQEKAKQDILQKADPNAALLIMDWAMKFLQLRYREKQYDWFGKRGLSWHITTVISLDEASNSLELRSYAHLFDSCSQDWFAVCSIIENTLKTIKTDKPHITKMQLRSDEAGCYHNNFLIAAVRDVAQNVGITITQYDFSEPQYGKDVCDRILCPMKACIKRYCNEGHDVLTAKDMRTALSSRPVRGTSASVCSVDERKKTLQVKKIDNFSRYHNFKYEINGVRVWKAYGVGQGKVILYEDLIMERQSSTCLVVNVDFFPFQQARLYSSSKSVRDDQRKEQGLFLCSEPGCQKVYKRFADLESHMDVGDHTGEIPPPDRNVYDKLRREWAMQFLTVSKREIAAVASHGQTTSSQERCEEPGRTCADKRPEEGWALHKPRTGAQRFSPKVKEYLTTKFDLGEKTGCKADAAQVAEDMRTARNPDGSRLFDRTEWLTKVQVQGFFSRLSSKRGKQNKLQHDEIELDIAYAEEEHQNRETLLDEIAAQFRPKHPIYYDTYCLCEMRRDDKLSRFSVTMLKEILQHFNIFFKSRDRKKDLLQNLSSFLQECDCCR